MDEKDALKELSNQLSQSIYLSEICNSDGIAAINAKKAEFLSCINRIIQGQKNDILLLKHISEQMPKEMLTLTNANRMLQAENSELKQRLSKAVELPCKLLCAPGDLVFEANINRNMMSVYEVTEIAIQQGFVSYRWKIVDGIYSRLTGFSDLDFGKTVFLTEAEAQAKLEEMKGGATK